MSKFRIKSSAHAFSQSSGNVTTVRNLSKDEELTEKEHITIKYTLSKAGMHKKLHRS